MENRKPRLAGTGAPAHLDMNRQSDTLLDQAESAARKILARSFTSRGLCASSDGYHQVWSRDAMITMLGASLTGDATILDCLQTSLETLGAAQDAFGQIPYLVHCDDGRLEFGASDSNVWWVIGAAILASHRKESGWVEHHADQIVQALDWCESMDLRKSGLMIATEMVDWADLMPNRDQVLFPNVLCAYALGKGAQMLEAHRPEEAARFRQRAQIVTDAIRELFWVKAMGTFPDETHFRLQTMMSSQLRERPYFLPWVGQCDWGEHFDTPANMLAILTGIADQDQCEVILDYVEQVGINRPYPVQVRYPAIRPTEPEWREYMKLFNLNLPHQYHNGGIWPWVGGLYVAALVKTGRHAQAETELVRLAEALRLGNEEWECTEWLHGLTGVPMGYKFQAWSAGMFLYARHAVAAGRLSELIAPTAGLTETGRA